MKKLKLKTRLKFLNISVVIVIVLLVSLILALTRGRISQIITGRDSIQKYTEGQSIDSTLSYSELLEAVEYLQGETESLNDELQTRQKLMSDTYIDVAFPAGHTTFTAPADGYLSVWSKNNGSSSSVGYISNSKERHDISVSEAFYMGGATVYFKERRSWSIA